MQHTSAPQESAQNTFYSYSENNVPINHKLEAWCPVADLIALVNDDNKLELYRLSWRLHWSVSVKAAAFPDKYARSGAQVACNHPIGIPQHQRIGGAPAKVMSLAWRPDGKAIAVGLADGGVNIYDYRDGSLISSIQSASPGSIHCLKWTDIHLDKPNYSSIFGTNKTQKSTLKTLPILSPIPPTSVQQQIMERTMFNKNFLGGAGAGGNKSALSPEENCNVLDEESSPIMNVLLSGDHQGRMMLRLFEGFDMESILLSDLLKIHNSTEYKDGLEILKADVQLDLSEITVIARGTRSKEGSDSELSQRLLQVTLHSRLLDNHAQEIRMLGLHKRPIKNLLQYLHDGLKIMKADYNKISQMAEDCIDSLQRSLTSNEATTTPTYEFIQMLLTGRPSETMIQFLEKELNTHDLKRWDKSVKAAYKNLQRVAFECLQPACERLLVILSDSLGCSRWIEQYGPLQLDEALVYNCIIIVGDFLGLIEGLFQAIKVELKQFAEFENWLEQVLEKLHPPAKGPDDPADDGPKVFPLVDVKGVSQYLKAGLVNTGLARFFQEADETLTPNSDQENMGSSEGGTSKVNQDEALTQSYITTPSYPIVYSFSDDLREASALKVSVSDNQPPPQRKTTNPFAGAAIAAAMAGRGFGSMPSKKSPSTTLFTKSSTSTVQSAETLPTEGPGSLTHTLSMQLTLERHLTLMTTRCLSIFEGPQKALAESMKVTHLVELLECESATGGDTVMKDAESTGIKVVPKFATRYCYHTSFPWHYLVVCLRSSKHAPESLMIILRSRKGIRQTVYGRWKQKAMTNIIEQDHDSNLKAPSRKRKAPDNSQNGSQARSGALVLGQPIGLSSTKPKTSTEEDRQTEIPRFGESTIEQDMEVAIFSLQEHDSAQAPTTQDKSGISDRMVETNNPETIPALAKMQSPPTSERLQSLFEVRDFAFLDDDSLCILLNSSRPTTGGSSHADHTHDDQFVVSVPLLTPSRPYQPLPPFTVSSSSSHDDCVLDRLVHALENRSQDDHAATSSSRGTVGAINIYTLPIDRSRCVTPLDGQSSMDVDGASRSFSFLKSVSETTLGAQQQQQPQKDGQKRGPTRIACNDREKGQVISVHSHNKISVLDVSS
ncbi:MAG: anaphase-promoting complex, cyclosome, subunit 4-domain-containing protein [Linnemannia gamsii]|nr:MAG: anaphase-promoting complex, cyclosome, subunit 4-domain-containing protein [Linnemannia gamsii]